MGVLGMSPLEGCWRGSSSPPYPFWDGLCVLCPPTGSLQSLKTPSGLGLQLLVAGLLGLSVLCTLVSGGLGDGVASTLLCLQLVQKVKVSYASIQEVLEPLNLDFSSLEKVCATVIPRPSPPQRPTQPESTGKAHTLAAPGPDPRAGEVARPQGRGPRGTSTPVGAATARSPSGPGSALPAPPRPCALAVWRCWSVHIMLPSAARASRRF